MKCDVCEKEIKYESPNQFYITTKYEMVYGEQAIYPMEIKKGLICTDCINKE